MDDRAHMSDYYTPFRPALSRSSSERTDENEVGAASTSRDGDGARRDSTGRDGDGARRGSTGRDGNGTRPGEGAIGSDGVAIGSDGVAIGPDGVAIGPDGVALGSVGVAIGAGGDPAGAVRDLALSMPLVAITNAIVRLHKQAFGRGPTKARARFAGPDMLIVLLQDGMTPAERNLVALGELARVREQRLLLQDALEDQTRELVERLLDRRVTTIVNGINPARDLTATTFVLEPARNSAEMGAAEGGTAG